MTITLFVLGFIKMILEYISRSEEQEMLGIRGPTDVLLFTKQNYKVHTDLLCTDNIICRGSMVFDTGAGT